MKTSSITHHLKIALYLIFSFSGLISAKAQNPNDTPGFANLLESVVQLDIWEASYKDGFKQTVRSQGSGVIMTPEGYILTNAHIANPEVEKIRVTLPNLEHVYANFIGWDHWTDLAVLQIDEKDRNTASFTHAEFGNSNELYLAQTVYAVGTPYGLTRSVTKGVISNKNRFFPSKVDEQGRELGGYNNWLQTDAAINPGNSGGPLVDEKGQVIGINNSGFIGADNLGFAIPAVIAQSVMNELIQAGEVIRSNIGITPKALQELESFYQTSGNGGLLIESIDPGSPAETAKLLPGDIILSINETPLDGRFPEQIPPIMNIIAQSPVDSTLKLKVKRGSEILKINVVTEKLESRIGKKFSFIDWGLTVQKLSKQVAREQKLSSADGFEVIGSRPGFIAQKAGLQPGDIITKANQEAVHSLDQFQKLYNDYKKNKESILLEITRRRLTIFLVLKPEN